MRHVALVSLLALASSSVACAAAPSREEGENVGASSEAVKVTSPPLLPVTLTTLVPENGDQVFAIDVDDANVYFTDFSKQAVLQVAKNGGPVITVASEGVSDPFFVASNGSKVFWTDIATGAIGQAPVGGNRNGKWKTIATDVSPVAIAVHGSFVYWTDAAGKVMSAEHEHPGIVTSTVGTGAGFALALAFQGGELVTGSSARLGRLSAAGGVVASIAAMPITGIATHGAWAYFTSNSTLYKVSIEDGTPPTALATGQDYASGVATDGTWVYWTTAKDGGAVMKIKANGTSMTQIAGGQAAPMYVAIDDTSAYWTNFDSGEVMKATPR